MWWQFIAYLNNEPYSLVIITKLLKMDLTKINLTGMQSLNDKSKELYWKNFIKESLNKGEVCMCICILMNL